MGDLGGGGTRAIHRAIHRAPRGTETHLLRRKFLAERGEYAAQPPNVYLARAGPVAHRLELCTQDKDRLD